MKDYARKTWLRPVPTWTQILACALMLAAVCAAVGVLVFEPWALVCALLLYVMLAKPAKRVSGNTFKAVTNTDGLTYIVPVSKLERGPK